MATVNISKIKFRRGTDAQRQTVIPDQGEPVYSLDTKRLYIGSGTDAGGFVVGNKNFTGIINFYSLSTIPSEIGDLAHINNKFYQLTSVNYSDINSWADVSSKIDPTFFSYNSSNHITLNVNSISAVYLNTSTVLSGTKIQDGVLTLDLDTKSLEISANKLSVKASGIEEREISSTSLSSGLIGGSGSKLRLDVDTNYFTFSGNKLSLSDVPVTFDDLSASWFGSGVVYDAVNELIYASLSSVDGDTILVDNGEISVNPAIFGEGLTYDTINDVVTLSTIGVGATKELPMVTVDTFGRVINTQSAIFEIFECDSTINPNINAFSALSALFNGIPDPNMGHFSLTPGQQTVFPCISSDLVTTIYLSSAGFIAFQGNIGTRQDPADNVPRFAIPIFRF